MSQFIKTPFSGHVCETLQVCQISYHDERIIDINYCVDSDRAVIQDNQEIFYFHNPDIENITIHEVLYGLGYGNNHIVVTWIQEGFQMNELLDIPIKNIPLSQISLYDNRYPIPNMDYPENEDEDDSNEEDPIIELEDNPVNDLDL
jgi:hypothetical protein